MATATTILAGGDSATNSNSFAVNSTPVTIVAYVSSGALLDNNAVGELLIMRADNETYVPVTYEDEDGRQREVVFRKKSMTAVVVGPGTYIVRRPDLSARDGSPEITVDKNESA